MLLRFGHLAVKSKIGPKIQRTAQRRWTSRKYSPSLLPCSKTTIDSLQAIQQSGSLQFTDLCIDMGRMHTCWNVGRFALGSLLLVMSPGLLGQVVDDFDIRFQAQQNGGIQFLANTTMYCGTGSSCTQAQNAMPITGFPQDNNNGHSMQYYDGDNDPATWSSSSDSLSLGVCAEVSWAGLYWAGRLGNGSPTVQTRRFWL